MRNTAWQQRGATILLWAWAAVAPAQMVNIRAEGTVEGARIRLRDLAYEADALPDGWADRVVAAAPAPGQERVLTLSDIAQALHAHSDMHRLVLRGNPEARIAARSQAVAIEALDRAVQRYLEETTDPRWSERRFRVCRDRTEVPRAPTGALDIAVVRLRKSNNPGRVWAETVLRPGRDVAAAEPVTFEAPLVELRPYWSVARPVERGDTLRAEDVESRWTEPGEAGRYYPATEPVTGMEARRRLPAGRMLATGDLAEPLFVKRGEIVQVISQRGGLTVSLRARALSDGRRDERIACLNERSGRRMYVRLVSVREAVLDDETAEPRS